LCADKFFIAGVTH